MKNHLAFSLITMPILALVVFFSFFVFPAFSFASTTNGTINSISRYAWSENIGWIDFGSSEGAVTVTDSALAGYAWSETAGWISLNCSNTSSCATADYKVSNNSEGTLSGYAFGENIGWVQFNPTGGGISIDSSGDFSGYAWGENTGWIVFNCSTTSSCGAVNYKVNTDWRPENSRGSRIASSGSVARPKTPVQINTAPSTPPNINPPSANIRKYNLGIPTLKFGSRSESVKELQRFLNAKLNSSLVVDGILGKKTVTKVKQWQKNNGLVADGLVGPKTKAKINAIGY
jgi:hypothetical protein